MPYALPLRIRHAAEAFVIEDANGIALVYEDPDRRGLVNRLSGADAKAVAQTIARALTAEAKSCTKSRPKDNHYHFVGARKPCNMTRSR